MKIPNVKNLTFNPLLNTFKSASNPAKITYKSDSFSYNSKNNFNKDVLTERKIISKDKDLFEFFDEISSMIFKDENSKTLSSLLKGGYVSLSTSCYENLKSPYSAKGIVLNPSKTPSANCAVLEDEISASRGVGINFSNFKNPITQIRKINEYFKYRESSLNRLPAGIALLSVKHPQILDFITLKDNEDFKNWCFDLSVVIPDDFFEKVNNNEYITLTDGRSLSARTIYDTLIRSMTKTGEPGVIFSNDENYLCDCCATAPLKENEGLTLAHINLAGFYNNSKLDLDLLKKSADILSKAMKKIDPNGYIGVLGYQTLLDKMKINYGSDEAIKALNDCLRTIKNQTSINNVKMALSPTGGTSKLLKVSASIEPSENSKLSYYNEIDTLKTAQKYLEGNISKTVILKENHDFEDVDNILRYSFENGIKGISVYKPKAR